MALTTTSVLFALAHLPRVLSQGEVSTRCACSASWSSRSPSPCWLGAQGASGPLPARRLQRRAPLLDGVGLEPAGPAWLTDGSWSGSVLGLLTTLAGAAVALVLARSVLVARRAAVASRVFAPARGAV